jgi:hypothetical protein
MTSSGLALALGLALCLLGLTPQAQDDVILQKADSLLDEAKAGYESAREKSSAAAFVDAGFKLEEARIKYLVLQEIGSPEKQKTAVDRLRVVNQLSKLIHDGKTATGGKAVDSPAPRPADSPPPAAAPAGDPDPQPSAAPSMPAPVVDVMKRAPVPPADKQKETEKLLKDLLKEDYAKKAPADRILLGRSLLDRARKCRDDLVSCWVFYQEAQQIAAQNADVVTALTAVEEASRVYDIDRLAAKNSLLGTITKSAKAPEEFSLLVEALDRFIDELMAADLYELADKSAAAALQAARRANDNRLVNRMTLRLKEVTEAKTRFAAMKNILQTLAKNPDDAGANLEMGQFLCLVKANWDLGLRFLLKGSDAGLRALAQKELSIPANPGEETGVADGWYELADKEKLPYRKNQLYAHAREHYEAALPGAGGLVRAKIEKRLETIGAAIGASGTDKGAVNLLKLVDLKKDVVNGKWSMKGTGVTCENINCSRLQLPYLVPAEYDLSITFEKTGNDFEYFGIVTEKGPFGLVLMSGLCAAFEKMDGKAMSEQDASVKNTGPSVPMGRPVELKIFVRRTSIKTTLDGKPLLNFEGNLSRLTQNSDWANTINPKCPYLACHYGGTVFTAATLSPLLETGKPLR